MFCKNIEKLKEVFSIQYKIAYNLLLSNKSGIDVDVKEHKNKRSSEQNAYYWLFNQWVTDCLNEAGLTYGKHNIPYCKDVVHFINKTVFGVETTTKFSIKEFCGYMEKVINFWIEETNGHLEIPDLPESYLEKKGYTDDYFH